MIITKDTIIGEIMDAAPNESAPLFLEMGMHCLGCPSARAETVEQACYVHGQNVDALLEKGFCFVTVEQLMEERGAAPEAGARCRAFPPGKDRGGNF